MTVTKLLLDIEVFYQLTILSCSPALLSWSSSSSVLIFLQFRPAILALQLFGIKWIPGRPGLTLLAFLAYSSSSSSNFSSSAVCNSAIYRIYRALWACFIVRDATVITHFTIARITCSSIACFSLSRVITWQPTKLGWIIFPTSDLNYLIVKYVCFVVLQNFHLEVGSTEAHLKKTFVSSWF